MNFRQVERVVAGVDTSDGAGVRLKRIIANAELDHLDPFLLLDEFKSDDRADYLAGFPDHPHRGFETVTYMLAGAMEHRDHRGNHGHLETGSVQWMTAGRGIIHSEMPEQEEGLMWGFQLWVNLPARDKMCEPRYQDIPPESVPEIQRHDGVKIRVLAGRSGGLEGAVRGIATDPLYLDVAMPRGSRFTQEVASWANACCYVFEGAGGFGASEDDAGVPVRAGQLAVLGAGDTLLVRTSSEPVRFLVLAARPLGEPVARHGPFVMNTRAELMQAVRDYEDGTLLG